MVRLSDGVARATESYDRLLLASGHIDDTVAVLHDHAVGHGIVQGRQSARLVLRPTMLSEEQYADACARALCVVRALGRAVERLLSDPTVRRRLCIPEYLEPLVNLDAGQNRSFLGRCDGFFDETGQFKVIEFNPQPQQFQVGMELNHAFEKAPITHEFSKRYSRRWVNLFERTYDTLLRRHQMNERKGPPTIGVVAKDHDVGADVDRKWMPYVASRGCRVIAARPDEYKYANGVLFARGVPVQCVVVTAWADVVLAPEKFAAVTNASRDGRIDVVSGLSRSIFAGYKSTLELLSDIEHRQWLGADVGAVLDQAVPWTRVVRDCRTVKDGVQIDLLEYASQNREHLVIKPSGGDSGAGVILGWMVGKDVWDGALARGTGNHVVQQRVRVPVATRPLYEGGCVEWPLVSTDACPFVWDCGAADGWLGRVARPGCLQNGATGGLATATWIVSERGSENRTPAIHGSA